MPTPPLIARTCQELRATVAAARQRGCSIGVVPTMGALHAGHLSLVQRARSGCDFTIATIFVNPTQFAAGEDLGEYPRTFAADIEMLSRHEVDVVFAPADGEMYPPGFSTWVQPPEVALPLEGRQRPEHFRGVTTVVLKLLNLTSADVAWFGQKDFQQALVIQRMVADLNLNVKIEVCPIVREPDGLAMSSRNAYLSTEERRQALSLSQSLEQAAAAIAGGESDAAAVQAGIRRQLAAAGLTEIDYIAIVDPETLAGQNPLEPPTLIALAVQVGKTRLIDNRLV